jgi:hypothetical protein
VISENQPKGPGIRSDTLQIRRRAHKELVRALEHAGARLSVAAASDAKLTLIERRAAYLETLERVRRLIKALRFCQLHEEHLPFDLALRAAERLSATLRGEARRGEALELHQDLRGILPSLESLASSTIAGERPVRRIARGR